MKLLIASDIHGAAGYCRDLLAAWDREGADRLTAVIETHFSPLYPHAEYAENYRIGRRGTERQEQNMPRFMQSTA